MGYHGTGTRNTHVHVTSYIHAYQVRGEKKQSGRGPFVRRARKITQGGNLPVDRYLLWSSCYAGGRPDICMQNWRWHKGMNLLTHGRTREQDTSRKWGLPYAIVRWTVVRDRPSLRVGTLTRIIYTSSCPRKIGLGKRGTSERATAEKKRGAPPRSPHSPLPSAVLHVTRGQERGKLNMSVAMEYRSGARPRARRRERNSMPANSMRISSIR